MGLKSPSAFQTGWTHAHAKALKAGVTPLSKSHFGAWVVGSRIAGLAKELTAAGYHDLIGSGRDRLPPDELAYIEQRAANECPAVADYRRLKPIHDALVSRRQAR